MRRLLLYFFSHRTLAVIRWDLHFIAVRFTSAVGFRRARIAKEIESRRAKFLNLGSGPRGLANSEWLNVDGYKDRNVDFQVDFSRSLPFPNSCFEGAFCEHVIEHFDLEQGQALLKECFRILRPGGCLRVIVPDGEKIIRTYRENPAELVAKRGNGSAFAIDAVNSYFRQRYEHQFIYDWPMLEHQFILSGFANVRQVSYRQGFASQAILLDDEKYAWESLYVEAVKPS
jgi:predicted SAM-dependent methyltransferase